MDIRKLDVSYIRFADDTGGTAHAVRVGDAFYGTQVKIISRTGDYLIVPFEEIEDLVKALRLSRQLWGGKHASQ